MSRLVCPYVPGKLRPETQWALFNQWPEVEFCELDPEDLLAYPRLLARLWTEPGELAVCEQDVIPPPGTIAALFNCPREWCGHLQWEGWTYVNRTLGLARFSAALRRRLPELALWALAPKDPRQSWVTWTGADVRLSYELDKAGVEWHRHDPEVVHLHDYETVGGGPDPALSWG